MNILVSGGLGYIGLNTVLELINQNHKIYIIDNLSNSQLKSFELLNKFTNSNSIFFNIDATDYEALRPLFERYNFEAILHFAGFKAVYESIQYPLKYYFNNLLSTIVLAKLSVEFNVSKFIFSSSATVYGNGVPPFSEFSPLLETTSPYGETKAMSERILIDTANANRNLNVSILRYFNPIGAHKSGLFGENPISVPNNLMPFITQVAKGKLDKLYIYGDDYDTPDGTGVRDYIHVVDLAKGHVAALNSTKTGINIYNLGTGKGTSVLELVETFKRVNKIDIPYEIVARRPGDIAVSYADVSKAKRELNWEAKLTLEDMVRDAWNFEKLKKI